MAFSIPTSDSSRYTGRGLIQLHTVIGENKWAYFVLLAVLVQSDQ